MPFTTPYKRGDIVLVAFPFTDLTATKQRPALVLWHASGSSDILVAAISSQIPITLAANEFEIPAADLRACGLPKASIVRLTKLVSLHERLVNKKIGEFPSPTLTRLLSNLRALF